MTDIPSRTEILAEPAGRIIDALVAELVMGIEPIAWDENTQDYYCPYCKDRMRYCGARSRCSTCNEWRYSPYKEYSSDIAEAWQVVEKMRSDHWWFRLQDYQGLHMRPEGYECLFERSGTGGVIEHAETAQLAICKAALLATLETESPCVYPTRQE
jgi:hypothetical protein